MACKCQLGRFRPTTIVVETSALERKSNLTQIIIWIVKPDYGVVTRALYVRKKAERDGASGRMWQTPVITDSGNCICCRNILAKERVAG